MFHRITTLTSTKLSVYVSTILVISVFSFSSMTFAALNNENMSVQMVESVVPGKVFIHLTSNVSNKPECARYSKIVGCSISTPGCEQMMALALSAKLSGRNIDFQIADGNECVGSISKINRLRID